MYPLERLTWYKVKPDYKEAHLAKTSTDFYCGRAVWQDSSKVSRHDVESGRCSACKARRKEAEEWESWDREYQRLSVKLKVRPLDDFSVDEVRKFELMFKLNSLKVLNVAAWVAAYFNGETLGEDR